MRKLYEIYTVISNKAKRKGCFIPLTCFCIFTIAGFAACSSDRAGKVNDKTQLESGDIDHEDFVHLISEEDMIGDIEYLSKEPRAIDTKAIDLIQKYIESELTQMDYKVDQQPFYYTDERNAKSLESRSNLDLYLEGAFTNNKSDKKGVNLIAESGKGSRDKTLIISAHYDTGTDSVGANDNGSGVAILLQTAKILSETELPYNLRFLFFSGEEAWFLGSRYYVANLSDVERKNILGVINVDTVAEKSDLGYWVMVGEGEQVTDEEGGPEYRPVENDMSNLFTSNERFDLVCQMNSDHYPFSQAGIPAISIVQDMSNELKANSCGDTVETIDPKRLEEVAFMLLESVYKFSGRN